MLPRAVTGSSADASRLKFLSPIRCISKGWRRVRCGKRAGEGEALARGQTRMWGDGILGRLVIYIRAIKTPSRMADRTKGSVQCSRFLLAVT